ncbi:hypothetical protein [Streptomyces flaveus]|uniref:hypothetical protein n=1 Tax=Streptomyces flaveus TaxID=66370 RepID=UPI0016716FE9|nr:hypothetical protein [Streptomyces flaveus]
MQDRDAVVGPLERLRTKYSSIRLVWADGGCAGRLIDWAAERLRPAVEIVRRPDDEPTPITSHSPACTARCMASRVRNPPVTASGMSPTPGSFVGIGLGATGV